MTMSDAAHSIQIPERLVRVMGGTPNIDLEQRTIEATVATRLLARDGGILEPAGIVTKAFLANPVVQALHGMGGGRNSPVVGRCLALTVDTRGVNARTQFADTELGREYAYLFGVNPKREVFMRAWSFGWNTLSMRWLTLAEARTLLGSDWDEETVPAFCRRYDEVWVADRSEMLEYSAVPVGADREALSRAFGGGVRLAGELIAGMDLTEAQSAIAELRAWKKDVEPKLEQFERDLMAMRRDGAAAAARGDTAELVNGLRDLANTLKQPRG
jgi:hypothetical protein